MIDIIIFGAGGMGKETTCMIGDINGKSPMFRLVGFSVDDDYHQDSMKVMGFSVYSREWLINHKDDVFCVCAIGYPRDRRKTMIELGKEGVHFVTLIHPLASIVDKGCIGEGSIIGAYCSIAPDCRLGKGAFLNGPMVAVGHDCVFDDYVTCFPKVQISGGCKIGEAALIGAMSYIHEKRKIGREAVVAPGSIVMRNVKDYSHVFGNPAKTIDI